MHVTFWFLALCQLLFFKNGANTASTADSFSKQVHDFQKELQQFTSSVKTSISRLARQMMLQQMQVEEKIRSDGSSGIKQIRNNGGGTRPYHFNTFMSPGSFCAMHEHSNYDRTVGLGEFIAVLNGVEFRTRHNDYKLKMPSTTKKNYHATENIPFPEVPPSVRNKPTVHEQIVEMQQYFKAFKEQDSSIRNYEPYFKPTLCYVEGAWTTDTRHLDEPFESDRHFIEASSWFDLQQKIQYMSSTGGKNNNENLPYLPTAVINVTADGSPVYAQWNYRIVCHPIKRKLKLEDFKPIDDITTHVNNIRRNFSQLTVYSKSFRYNIAPEHGSNYSAQTGAGTFEDGHFYYNAMDQIMNEIPGVDNYPGRLTDSTFGELKHRVDTKTPTVLNTARYHRHYKVLPKGDKGLSMQNRGYSDSTLWVAQTTNPKIAEMEAKDCHVDVHTQQPVCRTYRTRSTYAIPLEIIWLTPLSKWNPYNIRILDRNYDDVTANGRNGGNDVAHAYNGSSLHNYYITPAEFFHGGEQDRDPADTAKDSVGVLDQHGKVQRVSASGIRIFTPDISGVGKIRLRYPVAPAHQEGDVTWKNLIALQDVLMDTRKFAQIFEQKPTITDPLAHAPDAIYLMTTTHKNPPGMHSHEVYITREEMIALERIGTTVQVYTSESNGHHHQLTLTMDPQHSDLSTLTVVDCDGKSTCWDGHSMTVTKKAM